MEYGTAIYTINLDSIQTVDNFKMSSIFGKARAVFLEETDYAVIGEIDNVQVFDNYIFVLDIYKAKKLFVFNKDGKYLRQIGTLGHGPGEYVSICDFCLDTINREIYMHDAEKRMLHKYNFDNGDYIKSVKMQHDSGYCHYVMYSNNKIYTNLLNHSNLLMELNFKTNVRREFLNTDHYNLGWNRSYFSQYNVFSSKLNSPKYVEHLMATVMDINEKGIHPYLTVKSKNWVKKSDIWTEEKLTELDVFQYSLFEEKGRVFKIQNYMEHGDFIYFEYGQGTNVFFVVFNKENNEAYQCNYYKNLKNDLFLRAGIKGLYLPFPFVSSKAAYGVYNSSYFELTEDDIALELENKEELIESLKNKKDEFFMILEYEFK
jgi:hypothetical protein